MPAYFVAQVEWHDDAAREEYEQLLMPSVEKFGGRFIAFAERPEVVEGAWAGRAVVLGFESEDLARTWYASPDYAAALELRRTKATSNIVLVVR